MGLVAASPRRRSSAASILARSRSCGVKDGLEFGDDFRVRLVGNIVYLNDGLRLAESVFQKRAGVLRQPDADGRLRARAEDAPVRVNQVFSQNVIDEFLPVLYFARAALRVRDHAGLELRLNGRVALADGPGRVKWRFAYFFPILRLRPLRRGLRALAGGHSRSISKDGNASCILCKETAQ